MSLPTSQAARPSLPTFGAFVQSLHNRPPYRWQERAARELAESGWWPALRAPTGSGKTSLIECWLYALAVAGPDRLGRRLVWVVDRRSVVDQVHAHAQYVVERLCSAERSADVSRVADALRDLGGGASPRAVLWRGGLDDESAVDLRDPLDPAAVAIVVSTVDQFGSRLLFRGYGLGVGSRALHAGILGIDTTVVVDEAHIAEPLRRTVARVAEMQARAPRSPRPPLRLCTVSATHEADRAFELDEGERCEPAIARRLTATKRTRLVDRWDLKRLPKLVRELVDSGAKTIGVVLNTVADARTAFEVLGDVAPEPLRDRVLLIGPVRPLERADLLASIPSRAERTGGDVPFIVVATQTIEVGVDLDFDALVTACAPIDALVQRFGRLDRAGLLRASEAVVLSPPKRGDPVYGEAAASAWEWLRSVAQDDVIDFGIEALHETVAEHPAPGGEPPTRTIRLLDLHVDALTVTDADDGEGPEIDLLLHGERASAPQVEIAWRRLPAPEPGSDRLSNETVERELELRPLHQGELVSISLPTVRRWLATRDADSLSDLESAGEDDGLSGGMRGVAAWRIGADGTVAPIDAPRDIRPTDRILVDACAGGLDEFGWSPGSEAPVTDLGSLAARGPRVVLDPSDPNVADVAESLASGDLTASEAADALAAAIGRALPAPAPARVKLWERVREVAGKLAEGRASLLEDGRVLVVAREARGENASTGRIVTLDEHQAAVEARVGRVVDALGIDGDLRASLRRAARHHDEGKRDPRFQAWLRGGRAVEADALAKSAYAYDPARVRRLREASGWPARKRHELVSAVAVARAFPDDPLAAWLVATHHGRNRPFPAAVEDVETAAVSTFIDGQAVDVPSSAVPAPEAQLATFVELSREHGPWGLAFLEALLMCADRAVSAEEAGR